MRARPRARVDLVPISFLDRVREVNANDEYLFQVDEVITGDLDDRGAKRPAPRGHDVVYRRQGYVVAALSYLRDSRSMV